MIVEQRAHRDTFASTIIKKFKQSQIGAPSKARRVLEFPEDGTIKAAYSVNHGGIADGTTSAAAIAPGSESRRAGGNVDSGRRARANRQGRARRR
jgi:hypothetical protein